MALTAAQLKYLQDQRALATQQATSGAYAPLTIDLSQGNLLGVSGSPNDVNSAWSLADAKYYFDPQYSWDGTSYVKALQAYDEPSGQMVTNYQRYNPTGFDIGADGKPIYVNSVTPANGQTDMPDYKYVLSPEQIAQAWDAHKGLSPLTAEQFRRAYQQVTSSPVYDFVDLYGRVITPGTKVQLDGGYYTYNPKGQARSKTERTTTEAGPDPFGAVEDWTLPYDTQTDANYYLPQNNTASWDWTPTREGAVAPGLDAMEGSIFAQQQFGGAIGEGGWSAIKGMVSVFGGPLMGGLAAEAGSATTASSNGMTLSEFISNGATWAELADAGFSPTQIALAGGLTPATSASLAEVTGMNPNVSSLLTNTGFGAVKGITTGAATGKDLSLAALNGASGAAASLGAKELINGVGEYLPDNTDYFDDTLDGFDTSQTGAYTNTGIGGGSMFDTNLDTSFNNTLDFGNDDSLFDTSYLSQDYLSGYNSPYANLSTPYDYSGIGDTSLDYSFNPSTGNWYDGIDWGKLGAIALPAASGIIGGVMANNAQNNATSQAAAQYQNALNQQFAMYMQQRADFAPYAQMGTQGVTNYNKFVADPSAAMNNPAYNWQKDQIDKNMNRQLSARGRSNSTYGMTALGNAYGNLASQEYDKAYNRMLDPIKIGQGAANSTGAAAQNMGSAYMNSATQQAANTNQAGTNNASLYSGLGAMPQNLVNAYNTQQQNAAFMNLLNNKMGA
jgi:hypothetical protein